MKNAYCPHCNQKYTIENNMIGQTSTCNNCQSDFVIEVNLDSDEPDSQPTTKPKLNVPPVRPTTVPPAGPETTRSGSAILPNKVSKDGSIDKLLAFIFKLSKPLSLIFAVLFVLVLGLTMISFTMTFFSDSVKTPSYEDLTTGKQAKKLGLAELDDNREIDKKYGDQISDLVKAHYADANSKNTYDSLKQSLANVPAEHRDQWLDGLEDLLDKAEKKKIDSEGKKNLFGSYVEKFNQNLAETDANEAVTQAERMTSIMAAFGSSFGLFMVLLLPAILRIERRMSE